jgi:hypothetical protein
MVWFLVSLPLVFFCSVGFVLLPSRDSIFWTVLFIPCWAIGIFLFALATLSTHPRPTVLCRDFALDCHFCAESVAFGCKHCRRCNSCRAHFDHHCRFINNCVTGSNYFSFFFGCLFLTSTWYIGIAHLMRTIPAFRADSDAVLARLGARFGREVSKTAFWVLFALGVVINFGVAVPMTVLVTYHVYFQERCISTYDYLTNNFADAPGKLQSFCLGQKGSTRVAAV